MFTGIVQTVGTVAGIDHSVEAGARLVIDTGGWVPVMGYQPALGDSINVNGVCLTIVEIEGGSLSFDVVTETLQRATHGALTAGDSVNLEPALLAAQPLGGHFVQGHIDGVGTVTAIQQTPEDWRITVSPPVDLMDYMVPKGGVAIDGVSLTIADVDEDSFTVALIPTTLDDELTTLGAMEVGARVNLEADVLAKTVIHHLRRNS